MNWDQAVDAAEALGKRLPHEVEYELAATNAGQLNYSWEATPGSPVDETSNTYGPVGEPSYDRLSDRTPRLRALLELAEWTMTHMSARYVPNSGTMSAQFTHLEHAGMRIVRGGDDSVIEGDPGVSEQTGRPRERHAKQRSFVGPGIGFRCVRGSKPHLTPDDFIRVVEK